MWMSKIMIKSFGGLKDVTLELKPGFTNIVWENEAGKSTIMAFIKMMFYGKVPGGNDISKNLRKKYLPWDESKMEGAIEFQLGDTSYRLEKSFGKTAAGDKVQLIDLSRSEEIKVAKGMEIGQQFLDLDLAAFEKTIFIQNTGMISGRGENDSIAEKISNLSNGMEEDVSMEQVLKRLLTAKEALVSKSGRTGALVRKKEQIDELEFTRKRLLAKEEEQREIMSQLEEKKIKICKKAEQMKRLKEQSKIHKIKELLYYSEEEENAIQKKEAYWKDNLFISKEHKERCQMLKEWIAKEEALIESQRESLKERREQLEEKRQKKNEMESAFDFSGEEKMTEEMKQQKQRLTKIKEQQMLDLEEEKALDYESLKQTDTSNLKDMQETIDSMKKEKEETDAKKKKWMFLFLSFFLVGIVLLGFSSLAGGIVLAVSLGMLGLFIVTGRNAKVKDAKLKELKAQKKKQEEKEEEQNKLRKQIYEEKKEALLQRRQVQMKEEAECNRKLEEGYLWISDWKIMKEQILSLNSEIQSLTEKIGDIEQHDKEKMEEVQSKRAELDSMFALYQVSDVSELEEKMKKQQLLEEEIANKRLKVDTLYNAFGMERMSIQELRKRIEEAQGAYTKEELERSFQEGKEQLSKLQEEYEQLFHERNELYKKCERLEQNPKDLEQRIQELKVESCDMQDYYKAVQLAYDTMNETTQEIRQSFGPKLNEKTAKYFKALTNDAYEDVLVQSDYGIMALKKGDVTYHSYQYLSQGTIDQAYLALRLALIEIISEESAVQRLPLFLDDIFMQYDEPRRKSGVAFLKEYAKAGQVILFTPRPIE